MIGTDIGIDPFDNYQLSTIHSQFIHVLVAGQGVLQMRRIQVLRPARN